MGNKYLIVSDIHLADVEDHPDGWKYFKGSKFLFDNDFDSMVEAFGDRAEPGDALNLVLNGDVVDFDLVTAVPDDPPWPVRRTERRRGLDATEAKSVWKLQRVLDQHSVFLDSLARFLSAGHKLIYVMGNHDREFHFPQVQEVFRAALRFRVEGLGAACPDDSIVFEPWFYTVPGEVYVEHGQQYDHYTAFRHVLQPTVNVRKRDVIALPMGNLSNRYLMCRMGYFNPHASDYILNVFSYFFHWLNNYAFTRRSLFFNWAWYSLVVVGKLLRTRKKLIGRASKLDELLPAIADRYGLETETVRSLYGLRDTPITSRIFRVLREFWIDRLLMTVLMTGGTIALALVPIPLWIKLMVPLSSFPAIYFIYEWAVRGESVFNIETKFPEVARRIAELVPVRVVALGHTHKPRLIPLNKETNFVDTGTWAPVTQGGDREVLAPGRRNYLLIEFYGADCRVQFCSWLPASESRVDPD